jgi:hypothetical protein
MQRYHRNNGLCYLVPMNLNQNALNQGAAAGALVVVVKLIAYLIGVEAYMSASVGLGSMVFVIAGMCIACIATRKVDGQLSFREAYFTAWLAAGVATLVVLAFEVLLFALVDAEMANKVMEFTMDSMKNGSSVIMDLPESVFEETKASILWWSGAQGKALGWLFGLIFWAVIAAIVGAVFKREVSNVIR